MMITTYYNNIKNLYYTRKSMKVNTNRESYITLQLRYQKGLLSTSFT